MNCMLIPSVRVAKKSGCLTNQALWHSLTDANSAIPRERSLAWGNKAASAMNPGTRDLNRNYLDGPMGEGSQHKHWSMDVNGYICIILYRLSVESDTVPISQNEWDMIIWMLGMQEWIQGKYLTYEMINELPRFFSVGS